MDLTKPPTRQDLERLSLSERVALEGVLGEARKLLRTLNDAEIKRLHEAGASQRAIAKAMGVSQTTARRRLVRLGLVSQVVQTPPQIGDTDAELHAALDEFTSGAYRLHSLLVLQHRHFDTPGHVRFDVVENVLKQLKEEC